MYGSLNHEDDVESLGRGVFPFEEEVPILLTEVEPNYDGYERPWHYTLVHEDPEHNYAHHAIRPLNWRAGDLTTMLEELRLSDDIFFSKILTHTRIALLRRRLQLVCTHLL